MGIPRGAARSEEVGHGPFISQSFGQRASARRRFVRQWSNTLASRAAPAYPVFMAERILKSDEEWAAQLTPEQFQITRRQGTEPAFTGAYWDCHDSGVYRCVCCGAQLFASETKFDSGTGWPSFTAPAAPDRVEEAADLSHGMRRTEVHCARCGAHLGHVFPDGPRPTGLRYCINSASLVLDRDRKAG
jgi:peptide-methionine (R)-S-oxide reductase